MGKAALVTGASGSLGRSLIKNLEASNQWSKVIAVSRSPLDFEAKAQRILLNLSDKEADLHTSVRNMYTEEVFHRWFNELAKMCIIPDYPAMEKMGKVEVWQQATMQL